jgi:hypothetical protein
MRPSTSTPSTAAIPPHSPVADAKQTIGEIDVVAFTKAIDKDEVLTQDDKTKRGIGQWPAGTEGTVVSDYGDHKEVEISDDMGVALDFLTVPVEQLELKIKYS